MTHTINKWRSQDSGAFRYFSPGTHLLSTANREAPVASPLHCLPEETFTANALQKPAKASLICCSNYNIYFLETLLCQVPEAPGKDTLLLWMSGLTSGPVATSGHCSDPEETTGMLLFSGPPPGVLVSIRI